MKRKPTIRSSVDTRGRRRELRVNYIPKARTRSVKLFGGPMSGRMIDLPVSAEEFTVGRKPEPFWTYEYAGKDGQQVMFALRVVNRRMHRFVRQFVLQTGKHPAIESEFAKPKPVVGRTDKRGKGARRRAEVRKLRASQAAWRSSDGANGR